MAPNVEPLHEHESVRDVVGRLLAATESFRARRGRPGESDVDARRPAGRPAVFLFTSLREGQGTSTVTAAVASAMADTGKRTALVVVAAPEDASGLAGSIPLQSVLAGTQPVAFGQPPLVTLQAPRRYMDFPEAARDPRSWLADSDVMIIDAPHIADGLTRQWVPGVEGVVLVLDGERSSVRATVDARDDLTRLGGHLVGVVLNRYRSRIPRFLEPYLT